MSVLKALILGLVQGLSEFLPISSSGHLVLVNHLLKTNTEDITFEIAVHVGTLVAVLIYFRKDLSMVIVDFFKGGQGRRIGWMLILATIPTAIIGFTFKDFFDQLFQAPRYASIGLLFTSVILLVAEKVRSGSKDITGIKWLDAIIVGIMQGLAIIPGISRSGSTIAAGLITGMKRESAARFSFLLAIPAILGAAVLHAKDFQAIENTSYLPYAMGFLASVISGYLAIGILMRVLKNGKLYGFSIYTAIVGIIGIILL